MTRSWCPQRGDAIRVSSMIVKLVLVMAIFHCCFLSYANCKPLSDREGQLPESDTGTDNGGAGSGEITEVVRSDSPAATIPQTSLKSDKGTDATTEVTNQGKTLGQKKSQPETDNDLNSTLYIIVIVVFSVALLIAMALFVKEIAKQHCTSSTRRSYSFRKTRMNKVTQDNFMYNNTPSGSQSFGKKKAPAMADRGSLENLEKAAKGEAPTEQNQVKESNIDTINDLGEKPAKEKSQGEAKTGETEDKPKQSENSEDTSEGNGKDSEESGTALPPPASADIASQSQSNDAKAEEIRTETESLPKPSEGAKVPDPLPLTGQTPTKDVPPADASTTKASAAAEESDLPPPENMPAADQDKKTADSPQQGSDLPPPEDAVAFDQDKKTTDAPQQGSDLPPPEDMPPPNDSTPEH